MTTVGLLEGSTEALYDNEAELRRLIGERLILLGAAAEPGQSEALADIILGRIAREAGRLVNLQVVKRSLKAQKRSRHFS